MGQAKVKRNKSLKLFVGASLTLSAGWLAISAGCGSAGFLGLQDYQRDILGGLATWILLDGDGGGGNGGGAGRPVPGSDIFDVFIDAFFAPDPAESDELTIVAVPITEPTLGASPAGPDEAFPIGFRVGIPELYDEGNDVTMRISLHRIGPFTGGCLVFTIDARRLRHASGVEVYGEQRFVRLDKIEVGEGGVDASDLFHILDIPINTPAGLEFPNDLLSGDFVAFELSTDRHDGGTYHILGVEFFESEPGSAELFGVTIFTSAEDAVCDCDIPGDDCNQNNVPDACDIRDGVSGDLNGNEIPDECEPDCNANGIPDDLDLADGSAEDCNENDRPDECDIADETSFDCDGNGVPDECVVCPPLDLVFVMDTSGSMNDEALALCQNIEQIIIDLRERGIIVNPTVLGILEDPAHNPFDPDPAPGSDDGVPDDFSCLTDNVLRLLGGEVPGSDDILDDQEDWGAATAIVAERFPWTEGAIRVIGMIGDEDPQDGDGCDDPGSDRDTIENAIVIAQANDVFVSPIVAQPVEPDAEFMACILGLATDLAEATNGAVFQSTDPGTDLAGGIYNIAVSACTAFSDCNDNSVPDACDLAGGGSVDSNGNGVPDECEGN